MKNYYLVFIFSLFFVGLNASTIEDKEFSKKIEKNFKIDPKGTAELNNKYGNMYIKTWDKNEVGIEVEIVVNASNASDADKVFDQISIDFDNSSDHVSVKTKIESGKKWYKSSKNKGNDFSINYHVNIPRTLGLELKQQYGDIFCDDLDASIQADVSYGNLTVGALTGGMTLELSYGKAYASSLKDLVADLAYSEFKAVSIENGVFETQYSTVRIESANNLVTDTQYDKYFLGELVNLVNDGEYDDFVIDQLHSIVMEGVYSHLEIQELESKANLEFDYGSIKIKHVASNFSVITAETDYVKVSIGLDANAQYLINLESEYTNVKLPENINYIYKEKDAEELELRAYSGSKTASSKIIMEMDYGSLDIHN